LGNRFPNPSRPLAKESGQAPLANGYQSVKCAAALFPSGESATFLIPKFQRESDNFMIVGAIFCSETGRGVGAFGKWRPFWNFLRA
jgi:hypothetical protein